MNDRTALPIEAPTVEGRLADIIEMDDAEIRIGEYRLSQSDRAKIIASLRHVAQCAPEVYRLRKGIQDYLDGNYASPRDGRAVSPQQKCPHGMFYWDACENCIDEHFSRLLGATSHEGIKP